MFKSRNTYIFGSYLVVCKIGSRMDRLCSSLKSEFPFLVMRHKRTMLWHRILHYLVYVFTAGRNKKYLSRYSSSSRDLVAWSDSRHEDLQSGDSWRVDRAWGTLLHEREHLRDFACFGSLLTSFCYLFVYLPFGFAYVRARMERRGYAMTIYAWYIRDRDWAECRKTNSDGLTAKQWWTRQFTSGAYGWMMPFRKVVERWYDEALESIQKGEITVFEGMQ